MILAGVSIVLTIGDNGVLARAQASTEEYNTSEVKDEIELALMNLQTGYYTDSIANQSTVSIADYFTDSKIKDELGDSYQSVVVSLDVGSESTLTATKTNGNVYVVTFEITDAGEITILNISKS